MALPKANRILIQSIRDLKKKLYFKSEKESGRKFVLIFDAEKLCSDWGGHFALKGILSVEDAKRAVDIGCTGIVVSNHGGRQLDGARSPFDQLADIVEAVGDRVDVICEGGIQRGTHMLKALSLGAKACAGGRLYLYALAAAGQIGVEKALSIYKTELERDMKLMGCKKISDLSINNIKFK